MYLVYKVTNLINGKIYIGMTGHSFQHRWKQHLTDVKNHRNDYVFHKALKKYGVENFKTEILFTGLTKTEAQQKEIDLIQECNSYYLDGWGYNMTYGGQCNNHLKGEKAPGAKLTDKQASVVRYLLKDFSLSFPQIAQKIGMEPTVNNCAVILRINQGSAYRDEQETYPIRADGRKIEGPRRRGEKNPAAKLTAETALLIIRDLENTLYNQETIGKRHGVSRSLVNVINRCKIWQELHSYRNNIRKESQNNINYAPQVKQRKYTEEQILLVIDLLHNTDLSLKNISEKTGVSISSIENINTCKNWRELHSFTEKIRKYKKGVEK